MDKFKKNQFSISNKTISLNANLLYFNFKWYYSNRVGFTEFFYLPIGQPQFIKVVQASPGSAGKPNLMSVGSPIGGQFRTVVKPLQESPQSVHFVSCFGKNFICKDHFQLTRKNEKVHTRLSFHYMLLKLVVSNIHKFFTTFTLENK